MNARSTIARIEGFSLIEALIAVVIFSIGILSLVAAQAMAKQYAADAQWNAEAMHHASALIGALRLADQDTIASEFSAPTGAAYVGWLAQVSTGPRALPGADTYPPTITFAGRTVTVQINWVGAAQQARRKLVLVTDLG